MENSVPHKFVYNKWNAVWAFPAAGELKSVMQFLEQFDLEGSYFKGF